MQSSDFKVNSVSDYDDDDEDSLRCVRTDLSLKEVCSGVQAKGKLSSEMLLLRVKLETRAMYS